MTRPGKERQDPKPSLDHDNKEHHPGAHISLVRFMQVPKRKSNSRRINRMLSDESAHTPVFNRSVSETSMDNSSMEDFWCELKNIKENSENGSDDSLLMDVKPVDDGEMEAEWLQEAGLSNLISGTQEHDSQALLSTLTRTQAAAVQKRYNSYTQTMRKKNKHSVRDVRDIFGINESSPTFEPIPVSPLATNGIPIPMKKPLRKPVTPNSCTLEKINPAVAEELSFEVSFSEAIVTDDKEKQPNQRIKKDDCILPISVKEDVMPILDDVFPTH
ncbi:unnamed protein product [Ranitomeya imitator]|uniref:Uncharacterized protein n=1 Tax=Ranitomeya imitator TaxID=111125 RepID=A0ABN9MJ19_9NEOB|nr:unnamed protein product [Ranitomeya imitator]